MSIPHPSFPWLRDPRLLAVLTGVGLTLAFVSHPDHPLAILYGPAWAWVALTPLLLALRQVAGFGRPFRLGWLAGFTFHLLSLYWIGYTQGGGMAVVGGAVLGAAYLSLFNGLFAVAVTRWMRRWGDLALLGAPLAWTAMEYLLSMGELGFPWMVLGHSQAAAPHLIQHASLTGVYGVSFAAVLCSSLLALASTRLGSCRLRLTLAAAAVPGACAAYGALVMKVETPGGVRVAVVQNNVGREKWRPGGFESTLAGLRQASLRALEERPDLVVWPETAVPCNLGWRPDCRQRVRAVVEDLGLPILTGAPDVDPQTREPYNAAFLFQPDTRDVPSYAKMHLVPFGERTPLRDTLPFLGDIDWAALTGDLGPAEFSRGTRRTLFPVRLDVRDSTATGQPMEAEARFAVLICFESVFPDLVRRSVAEGADFLVVITNDSWFGPTAGPFQHAAIAVLRAVENRTAIARCATSGVSLFIDRFGRTRLPTELGTAAVRVDDVALRAGDTFYTRHGDLFAGADLALTLLALLAARRAPTDDD